MGVSSIYKDRREVEPPLTRAQFREHLKAHHDTDTHARSTLPDLVSYHEDAHAEGPVNHSHRRG